MVERVDIIISTKNRCNDLLVTINKMKAIGFKEEQFYIIDDASSDETSGKLKEKFPLCNLIENKVSKGYIENRTFLMLNTKNDFILSLDDDSNLLRNEDLIEAVKILDSNKNYGIFHFKPFNQLDEPPNKDKLEPTFRKLRGYVGCGHLIKREVINKVGGYHKEFEFYCEELDYSLRALNKGYFVVAKDDLIVHHRVDFNKRKAQKSSKEELGVYGARWRTRLLYSNNILLCFLHYPFGLDILLAFWKYLQSVKQILLKDKDISNFIFLNIRILKNLPFVFKRMEKSRFRTFNLWFKYPDMTTSS